MLTYTASTVLTYTASTVLTYTASTVLTYTASTVLTYTASTVWTSALYALVSPCPWPPMHCTRATATSAVAAVGSWPAGLARSGHYAAGSSTGRPVSGSITSASTRTGRAGPVTSASAHTRGGQVTSASAHG